MTPAPSPIVPNPTTPSTPTQAGRADEVVVAKSRVTKLELMDLDMRHAAHQWGSCGDTLDVLAGLIDVSKDVGYERGWREANRAQLAQLVVAAEQYLGQLDEAPHAARRVVYGFVEELSRRLTDSPTNGSSDANADRADFALQASPSSQGGRP
jgi:hypothetical protein